MSTLVPYDYGEAAAAHRRMADNMRAGERAVREAFDEAGKAEEAYRIALAQKMTVLKAEGVAWTVCGDLARGDKHVAHLRYLRDVADGVKEAAIGVRYRQAAEARALDQLVNWSMRVSPDGQWEQDVRRAA